MSSARELQERFDASFELPRISNSRSEVDFLAVRIGGAPYMLSLSELGGVFRAKAIIPAPSRSAALLGLSSVRSAIVPIFDMGALIGSPRLTEIRWFVMSSNLGFAFEGLEGHLRVATSDITPHDSDASRHTSGVLRIDGELRPIIQLSSIVTALAQHKEI